MNQLPTRVQGKATQLRKMCKRTCHMKNQRSHREKEKCPLPLNPQQKSLRSGHGHRKQWRHPWSTQKNSKPSVILMAWTSRLTNLQCLHKYANEYLSLLIPFQTIINWKEKYLPSTKQKKITETTRKGVVHSYLPSNLQGGWINLQLSPNLQLGKDLKKMK